MTNNERTHDIQRKVIYIHDEQYIRLCSQLPKVLNRASIVHSLIDACGLLKQMTLVKPKKACIDDLALFHSGDYIQCVKELSEESDIEKYDEEAEEFGLTYDCPAFLGVFEYACGVTGGSITAAQALTQGLADIAINWPGGWHHAKRDQASGFCYFNDIAVAILKLRQKYERVLYIDLDLHHGDGVEDAFCYTNKVMTVSFHKVAPGFFPGSGHSKDKGFGKGKYYALNIPLRNGLSDENYCRIFERVIEKVKQTFKPEAVVCQCGADGLVGDPMESFNLTPKSLGYCVKYLMDWKLPLLLLGGGGYNIANTARCWAFLTSIVTNSPLPSEVPEHEFFTLYGPDYDLAIDPGNRVEKNDPVYIDSILNTATEHLKMIC